MRPASAILLVPLILGMCGCGTCFNFFSQGPDHERIYGGVQIDASFAVMHVDIDNGHIPPFPLPQTVLGIIDMPFSFIGDTLTLPITIPSTIRRCQKEQERQTQVDANRVADASGDPR